jgi:hypothetical protein
MCQISVASIPQCIGFSLIFLRFRNQGVGFGATRGSTSTMIDGNSNKNKLTSRSVLFRFYGLSKRSGCNTYMWYYYIICACRFLGKRISMPWSLLQLVILSYGMSLIAHALGLSCMAKRKSMICIYLILCVRIGSVCMCSRGIDLILYWCCHSLCMEARGCCSHFSGRNIAHDMLHLFYCYVNARSYFYYSPISPAILEDKFHA